MINNTLYVASTFLVAAVSTCAGHVAVVMLCCCRCFSCTVSRISPDSNLSDDISTESERVRFLQSVAAITLSKTRTRLNLKKLYAADGAAVRELLKLAQLLHKATHTVSTYEEVRSSILSLTLDSYACPTRTCQFLASTAQQDSMQAAGNTAAGDQVSTSQLRQVDLSTRAMWY